MGCLSSSVSALSCCRCGCYYPVSSSSSSSSSSVVVFVGIRLSPRTRSGGCCWVADDSSSSSIRKRSSISGPSKTPSLPRLPISQSHNGKKYKADCNPPPHQQQDSTPATFDLDCVGTGQDVECVASSESEEPTVVVGLDSDSESELELIQHQLQEWAVLVSPFFFWGTSMVAMKEILPRTGPFFVSGFRLIPAGLLLIALAASRGRPFPSGLTAWLSIALFGLVDAACFQGFLAQGLQTTSAGLGSVIIDSQPLTVAILAALFFGESISFGGAAGLLLGVIGLLLLEAPSLTFDGSNFSLWQSGEWWMLLAAQSMAVGTIMVRWVSKYSDPIMATGWHMVIGGLPLVIISILNHENAVNGSLMEFTAYDTLALLYTSIFGSAVSYGVYFYSATKGSLTKLSSLTFLTPMFASIFGFLYLGETFSPLQLSGAVVTIIAIYMVNYKAAVE